jgi:uncharacterized protein (TIGR00730 family)
MADRRSHIHLKNLCVFAGSSPGARPEYLAAARELGRALAKRRIGVVYGGGCVGLMGALADAVLAADGDITGVIPESLVAREVAHHGLSTLHVVTSMHERKALMADLSDGFVALPGGWGTLEEFFEVLTWAQLGLHTKPCGLLNVGGYFDGLLAFLDHAVAERFVRAENGALVMVATSVDGLLDQFDHYQAPPPTGKWIDRAST